MDRGSKLVLGVLILGFSLLVFSLGYGFGFKSGEREGYDRGVAHELTPTDADIRMEWRRQLLDAHAQERDKDSSEFEGPTLADNLLGG